MLSWAEHNPEFEIRLWNDTEAEGLVRCAWN
eukprot:COSAG05_NODE_20274_length_281_cov_0.510989_1_plen_30_part_10